MAIDILLGESKSTINHDYTLQFDDSCYWYLYPLFLKIGKHTGYYIDLYQDCCFPVESQVILKKYLLEEVGNIQCLKPEIISFSHGKYFERDPKKNIMIEKERIYTVYKRQLVDILMKFIALIDNAQEKQMYLFCIGD